jgi:hypothetical protein
MVIGVTTLSIPSLVMLKKAIKPKLLTSFIEITVLRRIKMVRKIMRNPIFLAQKCQPATEKDAQIAQDLLDTLRDNMDHCVGMCANMIGEKKMIIAMG